MTHSWVKTGKEIESLREGGRLLAEITKKLTEAAQPGISTGELGEMAEKLIREIGGDPIFKGYGKKWGAPPFPAAVCLSVNNEVVHGIPRAERFLREGDLLKIDIGMRYQNMVTDMARTIAIGTPSEKAERLKEVTERSLLAGISVLRPGAKMEEYAGAVEAVVTAAGMSCVRDLVGHGVGHELHEDPQIPNYTGSHLPNFSFKEGMVVALEPMVNMGDWRVKLAPDAWAFVTADGSLSAHSENTVLITSDGAEVLTTL